MRLRIPAAILLCIGTLGLALEAGAFPLDSVLDKVEQLTQPDKKASSLPESDIVSGLKEALAKGATDAINTLGHTNGFWDNPAVRIPLPESLESVAGVARKLGQGARVDAFQHSLNRAAEEAVPQVASIVGDAIRKMTLSDAREILSGGDHAATHYFRRVAGPALVARIKPIVARETSSVGVTEKYKAFMASSQDSALGSVLSMLGGDAYSSDSLDLDDYVTRKTIDGLFYEIGKEEAAIRDNPAARTTDLLKKVFGGH